MSIKRPGFSDFSIVTFGADIGASATTIYTGTDNYFLIKKIIASNDTGGSINFSLLLGSDVLIPDVSVATKSESLYSDVTDLVIPPNLDLSVTGQNLYVYGWGYPISKYREVLRD